MKKLRLLFLVTAITVLLSGCRLLFPFYLLDYLDSAQTTTEAPLPIGSDVPSHIDAEDIYYRAKFASSNEIYQYTQELTYHFEEDYEGYKYPYQVQENKQVILADEECAVNIISQIFPVDYPEDFSEYQEYYRDESGSLAYYYAEPENDIYVREVIPLDGYTPFYIVIAYHVNSIPMDITDLTLEPQTRILNDREVYVLNASQSALYVFGSTGNEALDAQLNKRSIPTIWYVDAETYLPVRETFTLVQIDDVLWQVIDGYFGIGELGSGTSFTGFTYVCNFESFEPVEIPDIPSDIMQKAWKNAGASAG